MRVRCDGSCGSRGEIVDLSYKELDARRLVGIYLSLGVNLQSAVARTQSGWPFRRLSKEFWRWMLGTPARFLV